MRKEKQQHEFTQHHFSKGKNSAGFAPHYFSKWKNSAGFTLLYSVLVTSLLLSIGVAILNISVKEVMLSGGARDSQFAFYAADAGVECAFYWDIRFNSFATSTTSMIDCRESGPFSVGGVEAPNSSEFTLTFLPDAYCVEVSVIRNITSPHTVITSRGFNTCDVNNPRRVERALQLFIP